MPTNLTGFATIIVSRIGHVEIDAVLNENHQYDADITENPVEDGTIFSDNVILQPIRLEMTCRVTDASPSLLNLRQAGTADSAFKDLVTLQRSRETFDVVTGINVYKNMMLQSLSIPRESSDGRSLRFNAVLKEILIVGDEAETNRDRIAKPVRYTVLPVSPKGVVAKVAL